MEVKEILIDPDKEIPFHNQVDYCVGTGRMGLALTQEYLEQLKLVQEEIGFCHIRGHGLFCDDMAVFQVYEEDGERRTEYNFTYLDRVMDSYLKAGLRPFLELGFMPEKMASGAQTVFYWKGNVTPPKDYKEWTKLVQALLRHLMERYGEEEAAAWPVEVWNEPNLDVFWENADQQEYFRLFRETYLAVKEVNQAFQVGGPAVCGGTDEVWIRAFLEYCRENGLKPDFITRHHYTTDVPVLDGHYAYAKLREPEEGLANLRTTRKIIDSFPEFSGLPVHITEFNTSYTPRCPVHDTNQNAAYIAHQLSRLGDDNESYSYWTFGDVFEESGVPFTPFYGGFGLVAQGCIPKPTFWTFAFFKRMKEKGLSCVHRDESSLMLRRKDGGYVGAAWNMSLDRTGQTKELAFRIPGWTLECTLLCRTVDEEHGNPLRVWHDLGEPAHLNEEQTQILRECARPWVTSERLDINGKDLSFKLRLKEHAVVYFEVIPGQVRSDRGYDYERVMQFKL